MTKFKTFAINNKLQKNPEILRVLTLQLSKKQVRTAHLNSCRLLRPTLNWHFKFWNFICDFVSENYGRSAKIPPKQFFSPIYTYQNFFIKIWRLEVLNSKSKMFTSSYPPPPQKKKKKMATIKRTGPSAFRWTKQIVTLWPKNMWKIIF